MFFIYLSDGFARLPPSTLFPYTTLFRSGMRHGGAPSLRRLSQGVRAIAALTTPGRRPPGCTTWRMPDRKSTRLNSSHANSSYAVFSSKKKNYRKRADAQTIMNIKDQYKY